MGNLFTPKTTTTNQSVKPPSDVLAQYQSLLGRASGVSNDPLVSPLNQTQNAAIGSFNQIPNQYLPQALSYAQQGASSISPDQISNYSNPFQQQVVNATMGNINETNAEQQNQLKGNALAQGALGGDRLGVAQGELARQQGLANNQTLAGLNAGNYQQALQAAQADRSAQAYGAQNLAGLQTSALQAATGQLGAGTVQQNQTNAQLQQPYQQATWLSSLLGGLGPLEGQTQSTAVPGPSLGQSLLGGIATFLGAAKRGGAIKGYDAGGDIGGIGIDVPLYQPLATSRAPSFANPNQNGQGGQDPFGKSMAGIGSGLGNWYAGLTSPDQTGGMGLGMGQLYARGGIVARAPGGMIPPPQQGSNVGQMITNAVNMARVLKGGIGSGMQSQPQGFDDGGTVAPPWATGPDFGSDFSPGIGAATLQGVGDLPIVPKVNLRTTVAPTNLGTAASRVAAHAPTAGAPMSLTGAQPGAVAANAGAAQPTPQGQPSADPMADPSGIGAGAAPQPGGMGTDPYARPALFAGKSGRTMNMPLMAAGLGMMASSSPFLGQAIGQGGLEALNYMQQQRNYERQIALAQNEMNYRNERIDIAARNSNEEADKWKAFFALASGKDARAAEGYHLLSSDEVKAAGLPTGALAQVGPNGKIDLIGGNKSGAGSGDIFGGVDPASIPPVEIDPITGQSNKEDQTAALDYIRKNVPGGDILAKNLQNGLAYKLNPKDLYGIRSSASSRAQFDGAMGILDPNWDANKYQSIQKLHNDMLPGGKIGSQIVSNNTALNHIASAWDNIPALGNLSGGMFGTTGYNNIRKQVIGQSGDKAAAFRAFDTDVQAVGAELDRAVTGGNVSLAGAEAFRNNIRDADSPQAIQAALKEAAVLLGGRLGPLAQNYHDIQGSYDKSFLQPSGIKVMRKIGLNPAEYDPSYASLLAAGKVDANGNPVNASGAAAAPAADASNPPAPGARLAPDGNWYIENPPGSAKKYSIVHVAP